jgi:hypothetical protein
MGRKYVPVLILLGKLKELNDFVAGQGEDVLDVVQLGSLLALLDLGCGVVMGLCNKPCCYFVPHGLHFFVYTSVNVVS